jgi:hypothetical protein
LSCDYGGKLRIECRNGSTESRSFLSSGLSPFFPEQIWRRSRKMSMFSEKR